MNFRLMIGTITAVLALAGCDSRSSDKANSSVARPHVSIVRLHAQTVAVTAELPGRVVASLVAEVRPQVAGIVQKRLFQEGSEIAEGAPLYQIDPAPYRAAHDSALAALQKAEASTTRVTTRSHQGPLLVHQIACHVETRSSVRGIIGGMNPLCRGLRKPSVM